MAKHYTRWLWVSACAGIALFGMGESHAQTQKIEATEFPVMTRTHSDEVDPSLPVSSLAVPTAAQPAVPIDGAVAAEIAKQLSEPDRPATAAGHRIYAVREPSGSMLPGETFQTDPVAPAPTLDRGAVDETAVLDRMMTMNRSQVMRGVEDAVRRTDGGKKRAVRPGRRASTRIEARRLNPDGGTGMRRIDPDPPGTH